MADYVQAWNGNIFWDIELRRDLQDSELNQLADLLCVLYACRDVAHGEGLHPLACIGGVNFCGRPLGRWELH